MQIFFENNTAARGCCKYLGRFPSKIFMWLYNYLRTLLFFLIFYTLYVNSYIKSIFISLNIILKHFSNGYMSRYTELFNITILFNFFHLNRALQLIQFSQIEKKMTCLTFLYINHWVYFDRGCLEQSFESDFKDPYKLTEKICQN